MGHLFQSASISYTWKSTGKRKGMLIQIKNPRREKEREIRRVRIGRFDIQVNILDFRHMSQQ